MRILVAYATSEGQTRKVASRIVSLSELLGYEADLYDVGSSQTCPNIERFDGIVVAASVHQGLHQDSVTSFVMAHRTTLDRKPTAFISVSLSAALDDGHAEAMQYVSRFIELTGWTPKGCLTLGGAFRPSSYDYFERQVLKYYSMKSSGAPDLTSDLECTDWQALSDFVGSFITVTDKPATASTSG